MSLSKTTSAACVAGSGVTSSRVAVLDAIRAFTIRHGAALAAECRLLAGEDGAALAWATLDMLRDGQLHPAVMPLGELFELLDRSASKPGAARRQALGALAQKLEALADAEMAAAAAADGPPTTAKAA